MARVLHYSDTGQGEPLLLLHGMAASRRYWESLLPVLNTNRRVIAVDLLGFGLSPKPSDVRYDAQTHCESIVETLQSLGISDKITVVGHSMGALLALQLAIRHPEKVNKLIMVCAPVYVTPVETRRYITKGRMLLRLAYYGWTSRLLCTVWCRSLRPLSRHVAKLYLRHQPAHIAEDSVLHSWKAYSESLKYVISEQAVESDLHKLKIPVELVYGDTDGAPTLENVAKFGTLPSNVRLRIIPGGHNLPLKDPESVTKIIVG